MSSTTTTVIGLFKPVPGTAEPFRVADLNENMDLLDAAYGTIEGSIEDVNAALATAEELNEEAAAALAQFEIDSATAIAGLDTEAIIEAIDANALDIDGGTA
jgi:hypothetical protein